MKEHERKISNSEKNTNTSNQNTSSGLQHNYCVVITHSAEMHEQSVVAMIEKCKI
jgi:hypothetical protein